MTLLPQRRRSLASVRVARRMPDLGVRNADSAQARQGVLIAAALATLGLLFSHFVAAKKPARGRTVGRC
jgi:hypothetical protein